MDSVVLNEGDRKRLQEWFEAQPFKEEAGEREKLLEVKNLSLDIRKSIRHFIMSACQLTKERWSVSWEGMAPENQRFPNLYVDLRIRIPERFCSMEKIC